VVTGLVLAVFVAQAPGDPAPDLDRIRKALAETQAITVAPSTRAEGPVFRVTVQGRKPESRPWDDWSAAPPYVRTWFRGDHHEFLEQVSKEQDPTGQFRSATLYPVGIPVIPAVEFLVKQIKAANRKKEAANAREEVRRALAELVACRANPDRPGCH
jgi:hypothetical protein